jgi:hypothetical protein
VRVTSASEPATPQPTTASLTIFAWLWAAGMISHMSSYSEPLTPVTITMLLLALIVLFRPSLTPALLALLAVHLFYVFERLPEIPNHSLIAAGVDLTILSVAVWHAVRTRTWRLEPRDLYKSFAPVVRIEVVVVYFFVVFHKLNGGFFDPESSCGAVMYLRLAREYPFMPTADWMRWLSIAMTMLFEAGIPIMLIVARWRLTGLFVAFLFHFALAMDPGDVVFNFSAILVALFFLFLPDDFPGALSSTLAPVHHWWRNMLASRWLQWTAQAILFVVVAAVFAAIIFRGALATGLTQETARAIWVVYAAFILGVFARTVMRHRLRLESGKDLLRVASPALLIFPALFVLNGITPYLGAKTEMSFAMYSNLRTEGGQTNHWLIPASMQIWDYQRDLVKVQRTSAGRLRRWANRGYQLPYYEFRAWIREYPRASITYERNGVTTTLRRVQSDPDLMRPDSPLLRKVLKFRPVPIDPTRSPCIH